MKGIFFNCSFYFFLLVFLLVFPSRGLAQPDSVSGVATSSPVPPQSDTVDHAKPVAQKIIPLKFDTLAGPLPAILKASKNPYLVIGDIEVPSGKTVSIEQGTILLFKNFTGIHVQGKLVALGTKEKPIVFTSENDRLANTATALFPNPYDWNGVYIHSDAIGTSMAYCKVMYTVYGIVSETKFIRLDPVLLKNNGKSNLVIEGKEQVVTDKPFSYVLSKEEAIKNGVPLNILKDPLAPRRSTFRYLGLAVFVAGAAGSGYYGDAYYKKQKELATMSTDNADVLRLHGASEWAQVKKDRDKYLLYSAAGAVVAIIGAVGFSYSFTF